MEFHGVSINVPWKFDKGSMEVLMSLHGVT